MDIQPVSQINPSFGKLKSPRVIELGDGKAIRKKELLKMPAIKDNMDRFDIVFKPKSKSKLNIRRIFKFLDNPYSIAAISIPSTLLTYLILNDVGVIMPAFLTSAFLGTMLFAGASDQSYYNDGYDFFGKKQYADGTEIESKPFSFNMVFPEEIITPTMNQLKNADKIMFLNTVAKNYPQNGEFDAKSILNILQDEVVKKDYANGKAFNYSIDTSGHNSLLTKFFELPNSEENTKEYKEIVSIIKATPNVNFYQEDGMGISIIENILNMENPSALDLVKDVEFEHSIYLDSLFNGIQNPDFKEKARGLNIKFPNAVAILQDFKDIKYFEESITTQLESPFCDSKKTAVDVLTKISLLEGNNDKLLKAVNKILNKYLPENLRIDVL